MDTGQLVSNSTHLSEIMTVFTILTTYLQYITKKPHNSSRQKQCTARLPLSPSSFAPLLISCTACNYSERPNDTREHGRIRIPLFHCIIITSSSNTQQTSLMWQWAVEIRLTKARRQWCIVIRCLPGALIWVEGSVRGPQMTKCSRRAERKTESGKC